MARPLKTLAPAFIHVDVDDLWAVADCYGLPTAAQLAHAITEDALPRFRQLFREQGIHTTFFLVGHDLESASYVENIKALLADGHAAANHSYSHRLDFRALSAEQVQDEVSRCHAAARETLSIEMQGFRAPGYAASTTLSASLQKLGYRYDASLMPSPFGGVFRWMDARLQKRAEKNQRKQSTGILHMSQPATTGSNSSTTSQSAPDTHNPKTQYPLFRDTFHSLRPGPLSLDDTPKDGSPLIRLPSATTPLLRLPFQAGVCMRLGWPYFRACFEPYRRLPHLPFVFLFHAADLADFSQIPIPFFKESPFFGTPIAQRLALAERFVETISQSREIITTEEWLG